MKKAILTLCLMTVGLCATARELGVGLNALYGTKINTAGFGAKLQTGVGGRFRLETSYHHYLKHDYERMQDANLNLHYVISLPLVSVVKFYPIAGVTYANYRVPGDHEMPGDRIPGGDIRDIKHNYFGANLGVGMQAKITGPLWVSVDLKYQIIKASQFVPGLGLMLRL